MNDFEIELVDQGVEEIISVDLDDIFHKEVRNILTPKKLAANSELAKGINFPQVFGSFESELDYLKTLDLFNNSTLETKNRGLFYLKYVLPKLSNREKLLDIGPGDGKLTKWIGNRFKSVTIVDTNREVLKNFNLKEKVLKKSIKLNKMLGCVSEINLPSNEYDLVNLSHILYYIPPDKWTKILKSAFKSTKQGGMVAVVLSGDELGKAELISHYNGNPVQMDRLLSDCKKNFNESEIGLFTSKESIITRDLNSMLHIAGFLLCDSEITASKDSLVDYINKHIKVSENLFRMTSKQNFLLIRKE